MPLKIILSLNMAAVSARASCKIIRVGEHNNARQTESENKTKKHKKSSLLNTMIPNDLNLDLLPHTIIGHKTKCANSAAPKLTSGPAPVMQIVLPSSFDHQSHVSCCR